MASLPYIISFLSVASYALMGPIAKNVGGGLQPFSFIALASLILCVIAGITAWFLERGTFSYALGGMNWRWFAVYVVCNFVSYAGYLWAIGRIPVAQYEMFGIFVPIIGGLFAVLLLKEPFHPRYIAGIAFMAVGLYIAIKPDLMVK